MDAEAGLQLVQLLLNLQYHIREVICGTLSVAVYATYINIREVIIGATLQCRDSHLWRRRLIIEFNPQTRQQFLCIFACQCTLLQSLLVERPQVLVYMSRVHGVPSVQLRYCTQMYEPIHLNSFPQITRCVSWHPATDVGNLF